MTIPSLPRETGPLYRRKTSSQQLKKNNRHNNSGMGEGQEAKKKRTPRKTNSNSCIDSIRRVVKPNMENNDTRGKTLMVEGIIRDTASTRKKALLMRKAPPDKGQDYQQRLSGPNEKVKRCENVRIQSVT
uniref:Uncharacterized protein n=1 Tax=Photinus pyralis TaxID=7054 RepID=A0A1Y1K2K1_PHOPY